MKAALPTATCVEAYAASAWRLLAWLLGVILRLGATSASARLERTLSRFERGVECLLFLKAVVRYGPPPRLRAHPRCAPRGFNTRTNHRLRLFFRGSGVRARKACPLARVLALIAALARPERHVAYFFKHICNGLHLTRFTAVAPLAWACADGAPCAAAFADSS